MPEIVYVDTSSDDESYVESSSEELPKEKINVTNRESKKIRDSNQLILYVDKEKKSNEEIEALRKCKDYWKEIAQTRLKNIETMNVAINNQSKRIYELETSITKSKNEELAAKKARFESYKPQMDLSNNQIKYGIVVHSIPTTMKLNSSLEIKTFQNQNFGLLNSLISISWINPRNLMGKLNSSIVIYLSNLNDFENLLKKSYVLFDGESKPVKKFMTNFNGSSSSSSSAGVVCFKCEGIGHFARDCSSTQVQKENEAKAARQEALFERFMNSIIGDEI